MSRHTSRVLDSFPEPRLPLRDRLMILRRHLDDPELRAWGSALAAGRTSVDAPEHPAIEWIGGSRGWPPYWGRVWGLRLLLHVGEGGGGADRSHPEVQDATSGALRDESWRVREMALKVIARHEIDADPGVIVELLEDPVDRVRVQAARALGFDAPPPPTDGGRSTGRAGA